MNRSLAALVLLAAAGCSGLTAPKTFLTTENLDGHTWLDTIVDVDLRNVALADLPTRGAFQGLTLVFGDVDDHAIVSLEAPRLTRRQALWQLADKYGLTMTVLQISAAGPTIAITNRETRRENKPLN